jgi:translation initiation factor 2 beta subunit (eIF-2beta)/eIF-5
MTKIDMGQPLFIHCDVCGDITDHYLVREPDAMYLECEVCMLSLD